MRPQVQGTVVVLENKTGRILAMTGGFSYPLSQLNRATQAVRQPGSAIKPLAYLAALGKGLQPNTLVTDEAITLPPIGGGRSRADYWTPQNYDGSVGRHADLAQRAGEFAQSCYRPSARRRHREEAGSQSRSALRVSRSRRRSIANACDIIRSCSAPSRCGRSILPPSMRRSPTRACARHLMWWNRSSAMAKPSIVMNRRRRSRSIPSTVPPSINSRPCCRGCWRAAPRDRSRGLHPYVAGKTGTSDEENDAWFVGFTNDVTVAVWVGYDNADRQAPYSRRRVDRRQHCGSDLRAGDAGSVGQCRAQDRTCAAVTGGRAAAHLQIDRLRRSRNCGQRRQGDDRVLPGRRQRQGRQHPISAGVAREVHMQARSAPRRRAEPRRAARTARSDESNTAPVARSLARRLGMGRLGMAIPARADPGHFWGGQRTWYG